MKWMPTCRDTTELVSRAMDERLAFGERLAMRVHLAICRNCARFAEQMQEMRRLFRIEAGDETVPGLTEQARQRIETELQKKLES